MCSRVAGSYKKYIMSLRLPFIDLFKKSGLLFALLITTTLNTNAQGLFTPVASAVNTGGNCYRLTTETVSDRGAIWNNTKISLLSDFDISFTFNFGTRSGYSGGDGMAFVLQPAGLSQIGVAGSAKGWGNNYDGNGNISIPGISPSVVVDYDNYDDNGGTDALLSLLFNGDYRGTNPANVGVPQQSIGFVNDGLDHTQRVTWDATTKTMTVYTDGVQRFTYTRDFVTDIFSGQDEVYFGFTAATGGSVNQYSVCYNAELSTFSPVLIPTLGQVLDACAGGSTGSATINLQGGTNPFIVELNGVAHNVTQSNITANSVTFSNLPADVYSVRILESNGFVNTDLSFTIHDNPTPSITASGPLTFCQGGSVELTASAGTSYLWNTGETTPSITVTTRGNYTVTITNGSCASTSPPFEVLVNPTPTTPILALSGPTEFCEGGSVVISVTNVEGVAYQWLKSVDGGYADPIPGETGTSLTVTTAGRYTVMATSLFCGMIVSGTYEIFVNPKPIINAVTGNATICAGSTSTLTASSPSFGSTFQWSEVITGGGVFGSYARVVVGAGAEFTTPALSANATYEVIATDLNGCESDPQTFTVTVEPALATPTIAASRSLVLCSYNSVVLTSSSATDNTWSNGETTQSITVTPATVGSYTVTVNNGVCSATSEASVVTNAPAFVSSITASGPTLICDGSSVTYTLNETVPSVSRTWYRYFEGQYDPTFNETGLSIVVTKSGNYGVNIVDSYGCFSNPPGSHDVTVLPPPIKPLAFTISSTNACTVNSGTVAAIIDFSSGVAPINMTWNDGNGFTTNAQSLNNVSPGTYTATVVDYCGTTVVQAVTITGAVTASAITATATTVCTGATTTLSVSGINPLHTYQWYKDGSIIAGATGTTYQGSAGNYQIQESDGSCSAFSTSLFISERVVTAPLDFTVNSSNSCAGPNTGMIDQGPFTGGGFSYVNLGWTGPNGFFRDDVSMLSNLEAGTYTLGVRDFCGTVVSKTVTILQGTSFDKNLVINGPQILCINGASIRITAASGATTYSWNKTINGIETTGFANSEFIDITEAGVYSVVMTDAIGCQTYSFAYSIAAPNPPLAITAQSSNSCNAPNNGTANITSLVGGNIPYTISWSGPNGYTSSQYSINNLAAGVYTVTAQDACGTTVSANVTILEPAPQPQTMAVSGSTTLCGPESSVTISAYAGAVTYVWQRVVNNVTIPVAGSGNTIVATEPGAYYVSMTDANGCFQNSDLVNVYAANSIPLTVDLTSYTNGVSCFNGGGVANASYSGGTAPITFVGWTGPNGFTSTANNISSLASGTYIATYRDFCGVEATGSITFTAGDAFALPTVTPSAPFCGSNAVTLTLGATPYSFEWYQYDLINSVYIGKFSPNQNTIVLSTDAGYYYYPVLKDAYNCYGYPNGFATTAPTPITFSVSSSPSCGPNNGTANIFNISGGSYPVTYSWTDGASFNSTDGFITNLAPGTYTVTAMDACANAVSQSVTITGGITTATITTTTQNICSGSSAVLSVTNYNAAYSYQWIKDGVNIPGANGASYAASVQGFYYVRVTDGTCSNDANGIYISVASLPSLTVYSTPSCGAPNSGSAYIQSVSGGLLPFTYFWTDGASFSSTAEVVNNLAAGNYTVTVTDACGAQDTKSFTINQLPAVIGTITGVPTICTLGGSTILTASTDGTPASYAWHKIIEGVTTYDIASSNAISATEVGYYWVTIRDVNGCFSIPNIAITTTPVATITASGSLTLLSGQTVTLTASAGTSYVWSNGATTLSIVVSTAEVGTYTVTVTNNGCTTTSAPTVVSAAAAILPVINVPADMAVNNDPGTCGAIVNFTATETTGVPASTITYSHASGSLFPIGITTVTVTATNSAGVSTGTFTVTVTDNEKPTFVITAPGTATVTIPAMQTFVGSCQMIPFNFSDPLPPGAVVTGIDLNYSGQDQGYGYTDGNDDLYVSGTKVASSVYAHETKTFNTSYTGSIPGYVYGGNNVFGFVFTCYPGWQGFINGGTMTIRYTSSFGPKTVNSDAGKCDATLTLTAPNISDNCGAASLTNDAPATFPVGITNVNWTATDSHGNTNTITQNITVVDNQAPVVTTQNITVALTNGTVSITPAQVNNGSTDNCGIASYSLDKTSFDCSNVGTNTVTLTVTDIHGNSASATANVIVNSGGAQATITAGGPTTICTGSSVTLNASAGTGYLWSTGETTQSITVSISGSYTVTVSGSSDCPSTSAPTVVTVNPISTLTITPANPVVCSGSTLILNSTITGGTVATPIISSLSGGGQASAKLVVGLRRLVSTYGGPAIRLRRSSDNAESDFGFSGNELDLTAINSFLGGSTGFVTTLYDQSGNGGNVTQPATGIQPTFVANGLNGKPNMHMSSSQYMTNSVNYPSPFTVVYAAKQTGPTRGRMLTSVSNNWLLGWWAGLKGLSFFEGWVEPSGGGASSNGDTNPYVYTGSSDGSNSSFLYQNGTLLANNAGGITGPNGISLNRSGPYGEPSDGDFTEVFIFNTVLSTDDRQLVENSAASYYSIYTPLSSVAGPSLTVNPTTTSAYTINAIDVNGCAVSNSITVTVNNIDDQPVTAAPATICGNGSSTVTVGATQLGINYTLRNNANNAIIAGPIAGTGSAINFNTGTISATTTYNVLAEKPSTQGSLKFNGNNSYVSVPHNNAYNMSSITIEAMVFFNGSSNIGNVIMKGYYGWGIEIRGDGAIEWWNQFTQTSGPNSTVGAVPIGQWTHIAVTVGNGQTKFYVNGVLNSVANEAIINNNNGELYFGTQGECLCNNFDGKIDEIRIWNTVRTQAEIDANKTACLSGNENGLVSLFKFNDGAGTSTIDAMGVSNGLLNNFDSETSWSTSNPDIACASAGCSLQLTATPTVTFDSQPTPTISASGPTTFCFGGSVTLTASTGASYLWSNGATTPSITVSQPGNYSVAVTNESGCSSVSANTTVAVYTNPLTNVLASGPTTFCSGSSVTLTSNASTGNVWSTGETSQSITVSQSGNYSVTVTNSNGCSTISTITTVTVNASQVATITASGPTSFCNGGSVILTSSSATGNVWSTGETSQSITVSQTGNYSVTATDAGGCSAVSANTNVTVNTTPVLTPIVTASGSTTLCQGGNLGLSVAAMGGSSLRFNGSNYLEAPSAPGNSLSTAFTAELWFKTDNAAATQYLVSKGKSDGAPGQYGLVLVNSRVQLHLGGAGSASINSVTLLQSNTWYHVAGTWDGATGIARLYLNGSYEGQVTTGTNSKLGTNAEPLQIGRLGLSCCPYMYRGEMDEIRIWNVARDAGQIANGRSLSFGNTPNLVANYHFDEGTGAVTYDSAPSGSNATLVNSPTWQVSGAPVNAPNSSYLWSNGETTPNISVNTAGSYTATVTYVTTDGCTATGTSAPVSVTTVQAATVTASGPVTFCPGGSVILTASAGSAYAWSNGATTQSITVTQSGNYTVSVTNGLGCTTVSAPVTVSVTDITAPVPDLPSLPVISITPNGLITAPTATDDCSGVSVTGTTTDQVTNLLSGTYTITWNYIDASGNNSSQTQTVIVADVAPPSLKAMNRIVKNNDPGVCGAMVTYVMPVANDNASTTKVTINEGGGDGVITFNTPLSQNVTSLDFISAGEYQDIVHGHGVDIAIQVELYNPQTAVWTLVQTVQTGTTDYHFGGTSVQFPAISQVSQIRFTASQPVYAAFHFYEMSVNLNSIAAVQTAGLPSGSVFPIGTTLNTFRAVDQSGNEAFTSFVVEVLDAEKPRMGNYTSVTHQAGASGTWTGSAATIAISDNCGSEILQLTEEYFDQRGNRFYQGQSPVAQGNLVLGNRSFPVGANTVVVSIRDAAGNISDRARFNVSITDITPPTIVVSGNMTQTADPGVCAAWVKVPIPVTADNCSVQSVANSFNGSPSAAGRYPVGTTVVTWTVTDGSGNKTTAVQTITVIDTELPVLINVPVSMIQTNDAGTCGAVVTWDAVRATDNCGLRSFVSDHQSGEIFPLGETVVTFTATDRNGNVGTSSFTITVKDNEAPKVITRPVTVTLVNGSATVLPSAINNGSTDNCGAVALSASKTVFSCADVGINRVTLTVTDVNNNTSSGIALVTVIGETPTSRITVVPSNSTYTGGVPTDIYLGYGPQSVTLSTTVTGTVPVSYNWTGSSGLSCSTCANPVFTPTAAGSYRFTVVVTNSYGCTTTSSVTICVRDIRVPSSNGRVYVCHTDLGTGTITTVDMATNTVANYLLQNPQDKLGSCGMPPCSQVVVTSAPDIPKTMTPAVVDKMSKETVGVTETGLSVKASPNPTRDVFTFIVTSAGKLPVHIRLLNEAGQMQESRNNIQLGSAFTMGRSLHSGVYFAEVIQGKERVVVKLIKMIR